MSIGNKIMRNIVICPGHNSTYKGVYKNNFYEYDIVNDIVNEIDQIIDKSKYNLTVVYGTLIEKVNKINELSPDLAIEVHLGNSSLSETSGSRSYFMMNSKPSKHLAKTLLNNCVKRVQTENQGSWTGWYKKITPTMSKNGKSPKDWKAKIDLFLSKVNCVSAILEPFHISSINDCENYTNATSYKLIAESIISALDEYYEMSTNIQS